MWNVFGGGIDCFGLEQDEFHCGDIYLAGGECVLFGDHNIKQL